MRGLKIAVVLTCILIAFTATIAVTAEAKPRTPYDVKRAKVERSIKRKFKKVKFVASNRCNIAKVDKIIMHRKHKKYYVVETFNGMVVDSKLNGVTNSGYYISYKRVKGAKKYDEIVTYLVYRRGNNAPDDVIARYDFIAGSLRVDYCDCDCV